MGMSQQVLAPRQNHLQACPLHEPQQIPTACAQEKLSVWGAPLTAASLQKRSILRTGWQCMSSMTRLGDGTKVGLDSWLAAF